MTDFATITAKLDCPHEVIGPCLLINADCLKVLPTMEAQGHGQIINIGSIGALQSVPTAAVYCATKFAVRAISDALRQESGTIRVTCVNPGVVESELA